MTVIPDDLRDMVPPASPDGPALVEELEALRPTIEHYAARARDVLAHDRHHIRAIDRALEDRYGPHDVPTEVDNALMDAVDAATGGWRLFSVLHDLSNLLDPEQVDADDAVGGAACTG